MKWIVGTSLNAGSTQDGRAAAVSTIGARAARIVRLSRIARLVRLIKLLKELLSDINWKELLLCQKSERQRKILDPQSKVGAAMAELTNRR